MPDTQEPVTHPGPPEGLAERRLPLRALAADGILRLHRTGREALYFGASGEARFDDPERGFGVFYGALDLACCVAETAIGDRYVGEAEPPPIPRREFADWRVCRLAGAVPLKLVDLTGAGLLTLGADGRLTAAADYRTSQAWSRAFWAHPARPDGLCYFSRFDPACFCVALYDRTRPRLTARDEGSLLDHPELPRILARYRIRLVDEAGDHAPSGEPQGTRR